MVTSSADEAAEHRVGYVELLRRNRAFRNVWLAEVVSLTGDWFTSIALFALLLELTGKGEAVGFALIARFLPGLLFGPMAGVCADRFSRKAILITCDLTRALVVLGFLFIHDARDVWLAYALSFVQLSVSTFFETAEQASVGSIVPRQEIVTANALLGITWSAMLALGALLGGLVTMWTGRQAAFCVDSASFLLSALFVGRAAIPRPEQGQRGSSWGELLGLRDAAEGVRYLLHAKGVRRAILVKAGWGLGGGGALVLYSVLGQRAVPLGKSAATGIGLLYGARGLGALLGPLVARRIGGDTDRFIQRAISVSFFVLVAAYGLVSVAPSLPLVALCLILAHMGASTAWVFSNALINLWVPDPLKGRAFAADLSLQTVTIIISILITSWGLDHLHLSPRFLMGVISGLMLIPTLGWQLALRGASSPPPCNATNPEVS